MNDNILLEFYNHDYMGISVLFVKIFPLHRMRLHGGFCLGYAWHEFIFVGEYFCSWGTFAIVILSTFNYSKQCTFPEPGSPINSSLISNLTPCCGSLVTMS